MNNNKLEAVVGMLLIVIVGLLFTLAVAAFMLDTGKPAKMFPLVVPELWKAAYGQEQGGRQTISTTATATEPEDIRVISSDGIKNQITSELITGTLQNYTLYENGNATYTFRVSPQKTIEIHTEHPYTPERGYIYNSTGLYTPQGQRLVISTLD